MNDWAWVALGVALIAIWALGGFGAVLEFVFDVLTSWEDD